MSCIRMKRIVLIILANSFLCCAVIAQNAITGKVIEVNTKQPVTGATVYLSNSSTGNNTDDKGNFILKKLPNTNFTLVVSCIGYETFVKDFQHMPLGNITIELTRKAAELNEVIVTPAEKNGWINWGDLFLEHFIGTSVYARSCKIVNLKVLKFRRNEKENSLLVSAIEPVIIENKALGYTIKYDLKEFRYYFTDNTVFYSGNALFEEMSTDNNKTAMKCKEARQKVYDVSLLHFMRSLYAGTTEAEGFRILRKINKETFELKKKEIVAEEYNGIENFDTIYEISNEKTQIKIVANANATKRTSNFDSDKASISSILSYNNGNAQMNFTDTLQVLYTKVPPPFEYVKYAGDNLNTKAIASEISLIHQSPITIMAEGNFAPNNLSMNGFWGWWEKISIMLPYDYQPQNNITALNGN